MFLCSNGLLLGRAVNVFPIDNDLQPCCRERNGLGVGCVQLELGLGPVRFYQNQVRSFGNVALEGIVRVTPQFLLGGLMVFSVVALFRPSARAYLKEHALTLTPHGPALPSAKFSKTHPQSFAFGI